MPKYDVTVETTTTKTYRVSAATEEEAATFYEQGEELNTATATRVVDVQEAEEDKKQ